VADARASECCAKLKEVKWVILMHSVMHVHCIVQCKRQHNSLHKSWNVAHDELIFKHNDKLGVILICRAHAADEHWGVSLM